ncbi:protein MTSS 1-like [Anarrhichthys ocellatus]|uniref:protein MTSS 1-like n=1 Tax=Anarrhichthys ocellatus TaxID=433405 RepID=UPI0012EE61C2|nr:protein MTSS 1-like [Anarrhichthys ocellatus]
METVMERECSALGGLFQTVIGDMKGSYPVWDDFISKASKLQSQLRTTVVAVAAFLDAFQKVADMATNSRGSVCVCVFFSSVPHILKNSFCFSFSRSCFSDQKLNFQY